jgi:hypothetical protein
MPSTSIPLPSLSTQDQQQRISCKAFHGAADTRALSEQTSGSSLFAVIGRDRFSRSPVGYRDASLATEASLGQGGFACLQLTSKEA